MIRFCLYALLVWGLLIAAADAQAQQKTDKFVTAIYNKVPLKTILSDLQERHNLRMFYQEEWLDSVQVSESFQDEPLPNALRKILAQAQLFPIFYDQQTVVLVPRLNSDADDESTGGSVALKGSATAKAPTKMVTLSGHVRDAKTKEPGIGATILIEELKKGTVADVKGYYNLTIPAGNYTLQVRSVGMVTDKRKLQLTQSRIVDVELFEVSNELREIEISAVAPDQNVKSLEMGVARLSIKEVKTVPAFLGEVDVVRSVLAMPGVTTVGDGATGFNVRGGSIDQNLILQDDAPLFNSSHLFGFFSVFNPDMVKDVTLYRGGISSRYGGRVSSVLDVKMKDGNKKNPVLSGGVGILSSRMMVEGPLVKDKASFVLAGRGAYPKLLLRYVPDKSVRDSDAYFYDFNAKMSYVLSEKDQLTVSGYLSRDSFRFGADTTYAWGTATGTVKWNHTFNNRLLSTVTAVAGDYKYGLSSETAPYNYSLDSDIRYKLLQADLGYEPSAQHKLGLGVAATSYNLNPGELKPASEQSSLVHISMPSEQSLETAVYLDHEYTINPSLSVSYGLRYSSYFNLGPGDVYVYNPEVPRRASSIIDTLQFADGELIKQYNYLEPRAALRVTLGENSSMKLGYNRMVQYIHLISNTAAASPVDIWKTSNPYLKPQIGDQVALGLFQNLEENSIELSAEGYYKKMHNLVEYKDGARLLLNSTLDADLLPGEGKAYGLELMIRRKGKKLTGWASYTFSRSLRQVNGPTDEERINKGRFFPSNYDKPHDFTMVLNQQLSRLVSLSANFTYSTGRPITYPESVAKVGGLLMVNYSERNQHRIPDYHRLDLALTIDGTNKRNAKKISSWTFSVYNLYGRKNPYSIFFKPIYGGTIPQAYKLSVIGSAVPAITYNFKILR